MEQAAAASGGEAEVSPPDDELVSSWLAGDQRAFESLYTRYKGPVYRYFLRQLGEQRAGDCFQELWLKLIRSAPGYEARGTFRAYLFSLAHNQLMDEHRRHMRTPATADADVELKDDAPTPDRVRDRDKLRAALYRLLARLPVAQREAWLLRQETDMTLDEIAAVTDATPEGVKSRLRYATEKLQAGLSRYASES